jgi:hypothetical protein
MARDRRPSLPYCPSRQPPHAAAAPHRSQIQPFFSSLLEPLLRRVEPQPDADRFHGAEIARHDGAVHGVIESSRRSPQHRGYVNVERVARGKYSAPNRTMTASATSEGCCPTVPGLWHRGSRTMPLRQEKGSQLQRLPISAILDNPRCGPRFSSIRVSTRSLFAMRFAATPQWTGLFPTCCHAATATRGNLFMCFRKSASIHICCGLSVPRHAGMPVHRMPFSIFQ